jgi:hypothetical protein
MERDCRGCEHSEDVAGVHRICTHPESVQIAKKERPEDRTFSRGRAMAFFAEGPPDWCPLEKT